MVQVSKFSYYFNTSPAQRSTICELLEKILINDDNIYEGIDKLINNLFDMKLIIAVVLCLLACTAFSKKERTFLDFKSIIEHVNSVQKSWTAGHNKYFDGMDLEQIKNLMGTLETPEHLQLPLKDIEPANDIPE